MRQRAICAVQQPVFASKAAFSNTQSPPTNGGGEIDNPVFRRHPKTILTHAGNRPILPAMRNSLPSLAWSALSCGLVCCCGCVIPIPHLNHIGPIDINAPRDEVHAFLLKESHLEFWPGSDRGRRLVPIEPILLTDQLAHTDVTVDLLGGIPLPDGINRIRHTRSLLLYRPGYRVFTAGNWDCATAALWTPAETVEEQEAIVDSLLSLEEATPWDRVVFCDQPIHFGSACSTAWIFRPGENRCVPAVVPEGNREAAKADRRVRRIITFAADEYQRILELARQVPDTELFLPDECWPAPLEPDEHNQQHNRRIAEKDLPSAQRRRLIIERLRSKIARFRRPYRPLGGEDEAHQPRMRTDDSSTIHSLPRSDSGRFGRHVLVQLELAHQADPVGRGTVRSRANWAA